MLSPEGTHVLHTVCHVTLWCAFHYIFYHLCIYPEARDTPHTLSSSSLFLFIYTHPLLTYHPSLGSGGKYTHLILIIVLLMIYEPANFTP